MQKTKLIDFPAIKTACSQCSLQQLCLPQGLDNADMERLERLVKRPRPLHRGGEERRARGEGRNRQRPRELPAAARQRDYSGNGWALSPVWR